MTANSSTEPDSAPTLLWLAAAGDELAWAHWDDDYVLYHRPSGKTHFLNPVAYLLLQEVLRSPCTLFAAADALAEAQGASVDEPFREEVAGMLLRLEELGLVTRR